MVEPQTPRDFIVHPSQTPSSPYHIFFLPGNPGLVEYYAGFLASLHQSLNKQESSPGFHVAGCSFAGFEINSSSTQRRKREQLYSITEQTDFVLETLRQYTTSSSTGSFGDNASKNKQKVILIGHSFGTFAATEMMKRIHTEQLREAFEVVGGVLLFPPIPDLERSPRGSKLAVFFFIYTFFLLQLHMAKFLDRHWPGGSTYQTSARCWQD